MVIEYDKDGKVINQQPFGTSYEKERMKYSIENIDRFLGESKDRGVNSRGSFLNIEGTLRTIGK